MELVAIDASSLRLVVRVTNLDQPLRRIFPICRLMDILKSGEMGLVSPTLWEDPKEDAAALCMLDGSLHTPGKAQRPLTDYLAPAWAQCWSLNPGSDTLLRAYSRVTLDRETRRNQECVGEGVTVSTTVRRLLEASEDWQADGSDAHLIIGGVSYMPDGEIGQRIANACNGEHGPNFFCSVQGRAESLLWKRDYFAHEQEVRLLLIGRARTGKASRPQIRMVKVNPNALFTKISFDPRLQLFEANERKTMVREAGYTGEVQVDESYQKVLYQIMMMNDWPDP